MEREEFRFWAMSKSKQATEYVCVCLRASTVKASSVWGWNSTGQINDVVLKTFLSPAKFLHRYFSMKHQVFLTSHFILFEH